MENLGYLKGESNGVISLSVEQLCNTKFIRFAIDGGRNERKPESMANGHEVKRRKAASSWNKRAMNLNCELDHRRRFAS